MNENMNPVDPGLQPDQNIREERYIPNRYKSDVKSPVKGILFGFLIMLAFLGIQVVVMIPIMAGEMIGMATDMVIGLGTPGANLAAMGSRTYGSTRGQAQREGATEKEDRLYSLLQAGKEVGTELMFPGAGLAKKAYGKAGEHPL